MEEIFFELQSISKDFKDRDGQSFNAVHKVNMTLARGESIGIVGESGCGKSTLAKMISRFITVSEGRIIFKGKECTYMKRKALKEYYKSVQLIFQDPLATFSPRMKIGTYLVEPFINFKIMTKKQSLIYAENLLEMVGMDRSYMSRYPHELSGGQLQRVVIARAMGLKPDLIICDECTSALDVSIQKDILNLLQKFREETNVSYIFITHDLAVAESICDKIYVMQCGEIVEVLRTNNIMKEAKHPYTKKLLDAVISIKMGNFLKNSDCL